MFFQVCKTQKGSFHTMVRHLLWKAELTLGSLHKTERIYVIFLPCAPIVIDYFCIILLSVFIQSVLEVYVNILEKLEHSAIFLLSHNEFIQLRASYSYQNPSILFITKKKDILRNL